VVVQEKCTLETFDEYDYTDLLGRFEGPTNSSKLEYYSSFYGHNLKLTMSIESESEIFEYFKTFGANSAGSIELLKYTNPFGDIYSASCKCVQETKTVCKAEEKLETVVVTFLLTIYFLRPEKVHFLFEN